MMMRKTTMLTALVLSTSLTPGVALGQEQKLGGTAPAPAANKGGLECPTCDVAGADRVFKPSVKIRWKRLVLADNKTTHPRHAAAERAVNDAFAALQSSLAPLGVTVELQKAALSAKKFAKNPLRSNRIWINGIALEMYLPKARVGQCKTASSTVPVRTLEWAGKVIVDAPKALIVYAGLIAGADSVKQGMAEVQVLAAAGSSCAVGNTPWDHAAPAPAPGAKSACCPDGAKASAKKEGDCCPDGTKPTATKGTSK